MSEEVEGQAPTTESKTLDPKLRGVIMAGMVIILLIVVIFGANQRTKQTKIAELERSVDALSEAVEPNVLTDVPDKLNRLLVDIARAGNYREVSIADNSGKIIATTNTARQGTTSEAMRVATGNAKAQFKDGMIVIRRAIILAGDTRYGNLEIRVAE